MILHNSCAPALRCVYMCAWLQQSLDAVSVLAYKYSFMTLVSLPHNLTTE